MALVDGGGSDLRGRWPVARPGRRRGTCARRSTRSSSSSTRAAAGCWRRSASASSSSRWSTASRRRPPNRCRCRAGCSTRSACQLDIVRSITPSNFARFENRASIPTTAGLEGAAGRGVAGRRRPTQLVASTRPGRRRCSPAATSRAAPPATAGGVLHFGTPLATAWSCASAAADVAGRSASASATAYDVAAAGPAELRLLRPSSRTFG